MHHRLTPASKQNPSDPPWNAAKNLNFGKWGSLKSWDFPLCQRAKRNSKDNNIDPELGNSGLEHWRWCEESEFDGGWWRKTVISVEEMKIRFVNGEEFELLPCWDRITNSQVQGNGLRVFLFPIASRFYYSFFFFLITIPIFKFVVTFIYLFI